MRDKMQRRMDCRESVRFLLYTQPDADEKSRRDRTLAE